MIESDMKTLKIIPTQINKKIERKYYRNGINIYIFYSQMPRNMYNERKSLALMVLKVV